MRRVLGGVVSVLAVVLVFGLAALGEAQWEIRSLAPTLPERSALEALAGVEDAPIRVSYVNTATQGGPGQPAMAHPAFILEWSDGRLFAIDAGMDREGALAFGKWMELFLGSDPIEPHGSVAEQVGPAVQRLGGVAFTHLHLDHTGGLPSICRGREGDVPVFQIPWQADLGNYTTRPGREDVERASCARPERLAGGPLYTVAGFPGLVAIAAGGHTPGSTVYAAHVRGRTWVFSGDVTNFKRALLDNRPKPRVYSLLVTPEAPGPLEVMRVWLAALDAEPGFTVVVSHDHEALLASGLPPWTATP